MCFMHTKTEKMLLFAFIVVADVFFYFANAEYK